MLLNNNWSLNVDLNKWNPNAEGLVKTDFDALKQDVQSYRFYQKCLSGSTYVGVNSIIRGSRENAQIDDIYEIINHTDKSKSYYYDSISLTFSQTFNSQTPSNGFKIDTLEDQDLFLTKSLPDYNFTLKNLFTPDRLIKDQKSNVFYVDLSTTDRIENINSELIGLQIDGFFVREGQRVLVKDQYEEVTILNTIDPDTYFFGFYQIQEEVGSNITYRIPSSENGVYIYLRKRLVRTSELDAYENLVRYSIGVKMGLNNREKEYKLKRLNSGFYPDYQTGITYPSGSGSSIGESIYFEESHNFVLRQRVDYNNLFELSLNSTLAHVTQSITIDISTQTQSSTASYTIPQRILTIGEFGTIIVDQEGTTNIIPSKYKTTLRSISENTKYYWCVGDEGLLLRINKQDFEIKRISLDFPENAEQPSSRVLTRLNSIHFFNDLRGAIVGKFNQIWTTSDSGRTWKQIYLQDFDGFNFNSVVFTSIDTFFVGGDNGVFIEFNYNLGNWNILKRRISKLVDGIDDEFPLVDDIRDLHYFNSSGSNFIALGCELNKIYLYDIDGVYAGSPSDFIFLQDVNNINNFGDVTALTWISSTSSLFFSTFDSIYQVDPFNGQFVATNSNIFSVTFSQFIPQSGTNDIISFSASISGDELIYTGNFSLWKKSDLTPAPTDVYDPTFFDRLKPRLLFMDYDIGSKLYWFDDFSQYRIPERYGITISYLQDIGSNTYIAFNENTNSVFDANTSTTITYSETNWITYFKDRQKTFEFYSAPALGDSTKVEPSFTFSSSDAVGKTFSYVTSSVSTGYTDIVGLMPIAVPRGSAPSLTQSSRFRDIAGVSITIPANPYNLYFYDYLGIWNESFVSGDITPDVGDVLQIDSDVFEGDFIINKKICTSSLVGGSPAQGQIRFMINFPGNPTWSGTFSINLFDSMGTTTSIFGPTFVNGASYSSTFQFLNNVVTPYINSNTQFQTFATQLSGSKGSGFASLNITSPIGTLWNGTTASVTFLPTPTVYTLLGKPVGYIPGILSGGTDPISGENCFMYFYTDFNENILNNIPNSQTGFIVRDLNKYPLIPTSTSSDYFVDNFNKHYIGLSYDCEIVDNNATQSFLVTPKYSQWSAYYNLQTTVDVLDVNSNIYSDETKYASGFLNFGYSPTYNLLSYLNFIDPSEYVPGKEFLAMPNWISIDGPQSGQLPIDRVNIDIGLLPNNKIVFGSNLKYIWDSLLKWTFIDIIVNHINPSSTIITERLLIYDKFYDSSNDTYVIELHDKFNFINSNDIQSIDIISRRTLNQISDDLQYINRVHRPQWLISESYDFTLNTILSTYSNYETDLNFKVPTDSYCKILLSDSNIIKDLTGILYTDYKYELAMQVNKLDREYELEVTSITQSGGLYEFQFSDNHLLNSNEWVVVSLIGTQSDFPDDLLGYHNIQVTGTGSFILPITPGPLSGTIGLKISHVKKDYFFNYQPIDIFDMGIDDKKITQSVEVLWENWDVFGQTYNLLNLNLDKYKFRLIDGLDIVQLNSKFQWILEAEISDAIIGMDKSGNLIWYKGIWHCGRWFGGRWISGSWLSGDWYFGDWTSKSIEDNKLSVKIGETNTTSVNSYWYGGRWFGGTWDNGTWYEGRWYGGTWSNGRWFEGIWNDGTWNNGEFKSGIWVLGQWNNGIFNETNGPSFWLDGKFYGGDFETGTWYNGIFDQKNNVLSRFGTKSTNSRNSLWRSGKFLNGQFHSFLNEDSNGVPQVSDVHKYSIWKTGLFSKGDFYGGLVYNINFKNTVWHGGISEDIEVLNVSTASNTFTLSGEWDWNINDEFYLVDNMLGGTFSIYGSTVNPIRYKVLRTEYDSINDETIVNTNVNLSNLLTGNPIENSWVVVEIEENITQSPPTLQIFSLFQDSVTSGSFFSELVGSNWYIQNGQINLIQNNAPLYSITSQLSGQSTYTTSVINLDNFIGVLGPGDNDYDITFNTNGTVTLSLTQANPPNISGVIINITLEPSYSLRCVSSFENSTWKSGLWRNGVFRGGNFLGGVWYNGFMDGNFG
jgi:hypothetical protein